MNKAIDADRSRPAIPRFKVVGQPVRRTDMQSALALGQFVAVFQPRVRPRTGAVVMLEASLRWRHPRRGLLQPHDFLCEANQYGLLDDIADVLAEQASGLALPVSLNLGSAGSRLDLAQCDDSRAALGALLDQHPGVALTNLSTLLQWYIAAERDVALVQGDLICPPVQRGQLAQALHGWRTAYAVMGDGS